MNGRSWPKIQSTLFMHFAHGHSGKGTLNIVDPGEKRGLIRVCAVCRDNTLLVIVDDDTDFNT